ncbi:YheC/YheD family protein [Melghirimyces algeriensis]|uniref:YheC/D like ATP-grasp n=1 Tax=Melghirimyces algeriensis TaxID=910412 RepID=A0A521EH07_9BACL|nr:YheC/YheD family protein [Melghirimyces algeriensis]SMO83195.1 YheC/D like ATP-grasp [Melghirimyces algeriensis]
MDGPFTLTANPVIESDRLLLHPDTASFMAIEKHQAINLRFGQAKYNLLVQTDLNVPTKEIQLSSNLLQSMNIPFPARYEVKIANGEFHIGPFIGILAAISKGELKRRLLTLSRYTQHYHSINGILVAFALYGVNPYTKQISGYWYQPDTGKWKATVTPYPDSVFNRITLNKQWRKHFSKTLDNRLFNNYRFNKWEMYQVLSADSSIQNHVPETHLLRRPSDLLPYLHRWNGLYIKPVTGSLGKNVCCIQKESSGLAIKYNKGGRNIKISFSDTQPLLKFLNYRLNQRKKYIFQPILQIQYHGTIRDFRLILVKNQTGQWEDVGLIGRLGKKGAIVSSSITGALREPGETTIQSIVDDPEKAKQLRKKMSQIALKAAQVMDQTNQYGNFGMDFAIDHNHHIWLIEINSRDPHHQKAVKAGRGDLAKKACLSNMMYAKKLAGFISEPTSSPASVSHSTHQPNQSSERESQQDSYSPNSGDRQKEEIEQKEIHKTNESGEAEHTDRISEKRGPSP